jgi:hypothetical protein
MFSSKILGTARHNWKATVKRIYVKTVSETAPFHYYELPV